MVLVWLSEITMSIILFLFVIFIIFILFLLSLKAMKTSDFNILKVYLWIVSLIAVIWSTISIWVISYKYINLKLITDEEYINWSYSWELTNCKQYPYYQEKIPTSQEQPKQKSQEEIDSCIAEKSKEILLRRAYEDKKDMIMSWVWASIFILLFVVHFPFFLRKTSSN